MYNDRFEPNFSGESPC